MLSAEEQYNYFGEAPFTGSLYKITCQHDESLLYVGQTIKPDIREKTHRTTDMLGPDRNFTVFHTIQSNSMITVLEAMDAMEERIVAGEEPPLNEKAGGGQTSSTIKNAKRSYTRWLEVYAKFVDYKRVHGHLLVPQKDKELGLIVNRIRSQGKYTNGIKWREDKLDEIGFVWDVGLHLWHEFLMCENVYPDFNASQKCKAYGMSVNRIRKQGDLIKGNIERGRYLHNKGFKLHAKNAAVSEQRWEEYFETGTLDFWYCNAMDIQ